MLLWFGILNIKIVMQRNVWLELHMCLVMDWYDFLMSQKVRCHIHAVLGTPNETCIGQSHCAAKSYSDWELQARNYEDIYIRITFSDNICCWTVTLYEMKVLTLQLEPHIDWLTRAGRIVFVEIETMYNNSINIQVIFKSNTAATVAGYDSDSNNDSFSKHVQVFEIHRVWSLGASCWSSSWRLISNRLPNHLLKDLT